MLLVAVLEDFRRERIFVLGDVAQLFEQRQVAVGFHVAHGAGIAVPVPGAAEVAGALDDPDALDPSVAQPRAHEQAAEAAADDRHFDLVEYGFAGEARIDVGILDVVGELGLDLDVLGVAVLAQALVALGQIFVVQRVGVEVDLADDGGDVLVDLHGAASSSPLSGL